MNLNLMGGYAFFVSALAALELKHEYMGMKAEGFWEYGRSLEGVTH